MVCIGQFLVPSGHCAAQKDVFCRPPWRWTGPREVEKVRVLVAQSNHTAFCSQLALSSVFVPICRSRLQDPLGQNWIFHDPLRLLVIEWNDTFPFHPRVCLFFYGGEILLYLRWGQLENLPPWYLPVKLLGFLTGESLVCWYGFWLVSCRGWL